MLMGIAFVVSVVAEGACNIVKAPFVAVGELINPTPKRDEEGYDKDGFNAQGWNRYGINRRTGNAYDQYGFDQNGCNKKDGVL
ncbi:MAG: hypothetical protein LBN08_01055 [Lactobacillales bacterium]|jgi:hypothetical protein|nr:hypothetical protein [Lactobacillales bacterium]